MEGVRDGTIDVIASGHDPQDADTKRLPFSEAAFGASGLDTFLPAVEGTLRVLQAASKAGVRRVVMTSSVAAITWKTLPAGRSVYNETDWTSIDHPSNTPYTLSKTLAERAAWDAITNKKVDVDLTVINPAMILGPTLDRHYTTSLGVIARMMLGKDLILPNIGFAIVDVRDVAKAHVGALLRPQTIGKRYILADDFFWFKDIAALLKKIFPDRRIPRFVAPDFVIKLAGLFDAQARGISKQLGYRREVDPSLARTDLELNFIPAEDAIRAAATSLLPYLD